MTELTELGVKAIRDGVAAGDFTARDRRVEGFRHFARGEAAARHAIADRLDAEIGQFAHASSP